MTTLQVDGTPLVDINLPERVLSSFHKTKGFLTERTKALQETTQQAKDSLVETTGKLAKTVNITSDSAVDTATVTAQQAKDSLTATTHRAVDAVTTVTSDSVKTITETAQQAKDSLEQTLQTTGQLKNTTSEAIQTAISSSVNDWLVRHPVVLRLVQALLWATNHPILSLIVFLIALALTWSLIKAVGRLFEIAGLSLLKAPYT